MKILVRGTNWIGDAVMSTPALRELRRIFPDDHIALHTRSWAEGIFESAAIFDEILPFEDSGRDLGTIFREARRLRRGKFDIAVIFPNSFRSASIVKLAGIPKRFGFAKEGRGLLLTDAVPIPQWKSERHEVFYYLALVAEIEKRVLGTETVPAEVTARISIPDERIRNARERLSPSGGPIVAFGPGSTNSIAKRWPIERFAALGDKLNNAIGARSVVLGAANERDVAAEFISFARSDAIDLTGKTTLTEAAEVLAAAELFISNDMGLAHLAAAVGTKTLVIFGPTDHVTTRPFAENAAVIRQDVECSPCMLRECPIDHRCMTAVTVDRVFDAAMRAFRGDLIFNDKL
jgi:heptosyltransferase II